MGKSKNNFYRLADLVEKFPNEKERHVFIGFRMMALQNRYREQLNFTFDRLQAAINTLKSLDEFLKRLMRTPPQAGKVRPEFRNNMQALMQNYIDCLEDDLSTPEAIAVVFEMITWINKEIDNDALSSGEIQAVVDFVRSIDTVLGVFDFSLLEADTTAPEEVLDLLARRNAAKEEKNWPLADEMRAKISALGYKVVDDKS